MEWIKLSDQEPPKEYGSHRVLVKTKCYHDAHNCLAFDWAHPCGKINIAYYNHWNKSWHYETNAAWDDKVKITHWAYLPQSPID